MTPLDFMLAVMRDETNDLAVRFDAARAAAPFVHPRLSTINAEVTPKHSLREWMLNAAAHKQDDDRPS